MWDRAAVAVTLPVAMAVAGAVATGAVAVAAVVLPRPFSGRALSGFEVLRGNMCASVQRQGCPLGTRYFPFFFALGTPGGCWW